MMFPGLKTTHDDEIIQVWDTLLVGYNRCSHRKEGCQTWYRLLEKQHTFDMERSA